MKKIYILLFLSCAVLHGMAQIAVDPKGTKIWVDSSKWKVSGANIYTKNSGNTGIGTAAPAYKLDISAAANPLRMLGVQNGNVATDSVLTIMNGVVKKLNVSSYIRNDSTTANNGLTLSEKNVQLGGTLTQATTITSNSNTLTFATGGTALNITGLTAGAGTDSLVTINTSTGKLSRISPSALSADNTTAGNGLNLSGSDINLGGALTQATAITTSATNGLALLGLQSGTSTDSILVIGSGSVIKKVAQPSLPQLLVEARRTSTYTVAAAYATVIYNTASINVNTNYSTTTGIFTAPADGVYEIILNNSYSFSGSNAASQVINRIYIGTTIDMEKAVSTYRSSTNITSTVSGNTIVSLNAGDTVYISCGGEIGTATTLVSSGQHVLKIIQLQ